VSELTERPGLLLCGRAGAGKGTLATLVTRRLAGYPVSLISLADEVKRLCAEMLVHALSTHGGEHPASVRAWAQDSSNKEILRPLWQWFGTDLMRGRDVDHWVGITNRRVNALPSRVMVIVADGRFANEIAWARGRGWPVVWVHGRGGGVRSHISEQSITADDCDMAYDNSGSFFDMERWVDDILWDELTRRWPELKDTVWSREVWP
jgi:hypothetical protein